MPLQQHLLQPGSASSLALVPAWLLLLIQGLPACTVQYPFFLGTSFCHGESALVGRRSSLATRLCLPVLPLSALQVLSILSQLKKERVARENGEVVPRSPMIVEQYEDDDELYDDFGDFGSLTEPVKAETQSSGEPPSVQAAQRQASTDQDSDDSTGKGGNIYLV